LTQLENKISLARERAMQDDDQAWMAGEEENYTIAEPDRIVTIYNSFKVETLQTFVLESSKFS
jgi:hypothetical protein